VQTLAFGLRFRSANWLRESHGAKSPSVCRVSGTVGGTRPTVVMVRVMGLLKLVDAGYRFLLGTCASDLAGFSR